MPDDQAQTILAPVQADNSVKADAWQAFKNSANERELGTKLQGINLADSVKADLWEAKRSAGLATTNSIGTNQQSTQPIQSQPSSFVPNARIRNLPNPAEGMSPGRALYEGSKTGLLVGSLPAAATSPTSAIRALAGGTIGSQVGSGIAKSAGAGELGQEVSGDIGGLVGGGLTEGAYGFVKGKLPNTASAGQALEQVKSAAGDIPIDMAKPGNTALELYTQSQRGATLPKAVRDFVTRATKPDSEPLTYAEAKDFQSNLSRLSANERMNLTPATARLVGQLNADLKDSLANAADTVGKGQQFTDAMKEYHNAMRLNNYSDTVKQNLWKAALAGAGLYELKKIFGGK